MWIVKLGGSWVSNPELLKLIDKLYNYRNEPIVLVVGGGKFVDAIRFAHEKINFDEALAHKLSVKSTEIYAKPLPPHLPETFRNLPELEFCNRCFYPSWKSS